MDGRPYICWADGDWPGIMWHWNRIWLQLLLFTFAITFASDRNNGRSVEVKQKEGIQDDYVPKFIGIVGLEEKERAYESSDINDARYVLAIFQSIYMTKSPSQLMFEYLVEYVPVFFYSHCMDDFMKHFLFSWRKFGSPWAAATLETIRSTRNPKFLNGMLENSLMKIMNQNRLEALYDSCCTLRFSKLLTHFRSLLNLRVTTKSFEVNASINDPAILSILKAEIVTAGDLKAGTLKIPALLAAAASNNWEAVLILMMDLGDYDWVLSRDIFSTALARKSFDVISLIAVFPYIRNVQLRNACQDHNKNAAGSVFYLKTQTLFKQIKKTRTQKFKSEMIARLPASIQKAAVVGSIWNHDETYLKSLMSSRTHELIPAEILLGLAYFSENERIIDIIVNDRYILENLTIFDIEWLLQYSSSRKRKYPLPKIILRDIAIQNIQGLPAHIEHIKSLASETAGKLSEKEFEKRLQKLETTSERYLELHRTYYPDFSKLLSQHFDFLTTSLIT